MPTVTRRHALLTGAALAIPPALLTQIAGCTSQSTELTQQTDSGDESKTETQETNTPETGAKMKVEYLEIVTPEVEALCRQYASIYDIEFSDPIAGFGGARTAKVDGGGMLGIRGPLRDTETPVVRPYLLVDDIKAAVESAAESGAEVAMPPMEIPEYGMFAIVIHGGIECGFWQN